MISERQKKGNAFFEKRAWAGQIMPIFWEKEFAWMGHSQKVALLIDIFSDVFYNVYSVVGREMISISYYLC
jgi:hypothetical protein